MQIRSRSSVGEDRETPGRADTRGTHAWWLLTAETVGAHSLVVNLSELPPGTSHQLHRHANAEQAIIVVSGRGMHLSEGKEPVVVAVGAAIFIPPGEWHGFANPFADTVTIASVYGGVGRREDAGYELHPGTPFDATKPRRADGS
jgi:quercetin dioxygenase-like cupin family protein